MKFNISYPINSVAKYLCHDALRKSRKVLQTVSFFDESTTDLWTLKELQIQYVKDQLDFIHKNLDEDWEEEIDNASLTMELVKKGSD